MRVVHTVARVFVTVQYALPQVGLVHAKKHLRAVLLVFNLLIGEPITSTAIVA